MIRQPRHISTLHTRVLIARDSSYLVLSSAGALSHYRDAGGEGFVVGSVIRLPNRWLRCFLLVMCTDPFAKKVLTLHFARSEGHERYFGCNLMHRKVLASSS